MRETTYAYLVGAYNRLLDDLTNRLSLVRIIYDLETL